MTHSHEVQEQLDSKCPCVVKQNRFTRRLAPAYGAVHCTMFVHPHHQVAILRFDQSGVFHLQM
jgi:hypothetical protein